MEIKIQSIDAPTSKPLNERIRQKLTKVFTPYAFVKKGMVTLRSDVDNSQHNRIMEIRIDVLQDEFYAETKDINLFKALDKNINKLKRQLEKYKEKRYSNP